MIIFADYTLSKYLSVTGKCTLLSFVSPLIIGIPVRDLLPTNDITQLFYSSTENAPCNNEDKVYYRELFRSNYLQFLCEYDPFMGIMDIMMADYLNPDNTVILTDLNDELVANMAECIGQFIYDRWRYPTATVYDAEDYHSIKVSEMDPSMMGVFNADKAFYLSHLEDRKE